MAVVEPIMSLAAPQQGRASSTEQRVEDVRSQLHILEMRRDELKNQLESNTERRALLQAQLNQAQGTSRAQLEQRIRQLDSRTAAIEDQLNAVDDAANKALSGGGADIAIPAMPAIPAIPAIPPIPAMPANFPGFAVGRSTSADARLRGMMGGVMAIELIGFTLLFFTMWRWLRRSRSGGSLKLASEDAARIDALQRAVDVIAVEVERISESQRYVAKVLNEKSLGAGAAQEVSVSAGAGAGAPDPQQVQRRSQR